MAYDSLAVSSTAVPLDSGDYDNKDSNANATVALIFCEGTAGTNDVRFTLDGSTTPTSSVGQLLKAGDWLVVRGFGNIKNFLAIRTSADTTLKIQYF